MTCPRCGSSQTDQVKFCTVCGGNLAAVRQALEMRDTDKFDWNRTWLAEMLMTPDEQQRRRGITPEVKRYNEIKAGVITSSVGVAVMIFLFVFMQGLILNTHVSADAAVILSRVWIAGIIPFVVGLALIGNGLFISKKIVEISNREKEKANDLQSGTEPAALRSPETNEFISTPFSVTEQTTKHLSTIDRK